MSVGLQRLREEPDAIRQGAIDKGEDPAARRPRDRGRRRAAAAPGGADALKASATRPRSDRRGDQRRAPSRTAPRSPSSAPRPREPASGSTRIDAELATVEAELEDLLLRIPNPADPDVPIGGEEANVTVRTWGEPAARRPTPTARPGRASRTGRSPRRWASSTSPRGAKITGSGFPVYKGAGSALQRGLISWFLDVHTREHGFTEIWPPVLVNAASARGTGQIPDKEDQMYVVTRDDLYLVPTAEVRSRTCTATRSSRRPTCRSATPPTRPASGARPARPARTPAASCASTSSTRSRWCCSRARTCRGGARLDDRRAPRSCSSASASPTASCSWRPATWASSSAGSTTSRSGRRASSAGSRSAPARTSATTRHAGWRSAIAPRRAARPSSSTRSTALASRWPASSPRSSRRTSSPTARSLVPEVLRPYLGRERIEAVAAPA